MASSSLDRTTTSGFDRILNFRDVGEFINHATNNTPHLTTGRLFRSARLDSATPADQERLKTAYSIKTIIDLRTPTEHGEALRKYGAANPGTHQDRNNKQPWHVPGLIYRDVNFNGSAYSTALIKQLSYAHVAKLAGLYMIGYRKEAISVLGRNVMAERGLAGLAEDSLIHCTAEVRAVFDVLADATAYPILAHCTQGKDRTGLIVLLVLRLLGVPVEAINADYRRSEPELEPERPEKLVEIRSIGLPDTFADCPPEWVSTVCRFIDEKYGGIEKYLEDCGVTAEQREAVKHAMTG